MREFSRRWPVHVFLATVLLFAGTAWSATVAGHVVDENGAHPPAALVLALAADDWRTLASTETFDGAFSLSVPGGSDIYLVSISLSGEDLNGYALHGYTLGLERVAVDQWLVLQDIGIRTCYELILEGRHGDGSLIRLEDLLPGSAAVDGAGEGVIESLQSVDGPGQRLDVPSLCVPVGSDRRLFLRYELPGAGRLNLPFDRDGKFFVATGQGGEIIDLNENLARSQLARLDLLVDEIASGGLEVPERYHSGILWDRLDATSSLGPGDRAAQLDSVAADAVVTLEKLHLWKADRGAMAFRRGRLKVAVRDLDGSPLPGITVDYRQLNHDFSFGVFEPLADAGPVLYDHLMEIGLNFVTAGFFWKEIETPLGEIDWDYIDNRTGVRDLEAEGWRVKGHPLIWFSDLAMPAYVGTLGFAELKQLSVDHVAEIVDHYRGLVSTWDVSNEASGFAGSGGLSRPEMDEYLTSVFSAARSADPAAGLILNNLFDPFGHARIDEHLTGADELFTLSVPAFVRRCLDEGVDFDIVGQQLYNGGAITILDDWGLGPVEGVPTYDLGFIAEYLDDLAAVGKPIHITELSVPSAWDEASESVAAGYWRKPWNEDVQADYLGAFLRLAFGHPSVQAITWWNVLDEGSFIAHGGLVRPDGTSKPALDALAAQIAQWTSSGTVATDGSGEISVRGFAGDYELTFTIGAVEYRFDAHISEQALGQVTLVVDPDSSTSVRRTAGRRSP